MSTHTSLWSRRETANIDALKATWTDHRLNTLLAVALDSYNRLGNVDAEAAAAALGVSPRTVQRWIRTAIPERRINDVIALVRPAQGAFDQEAKDLINARRAVDTITTEPGSARALWEHLGWLAPHDLAIIQLRDAPVRTVRLARAENASAVLRKLKYSRALTPDERDGLRRLSAGGEIAEIITFRHRFAATVARGEILEDVYPYRLQLPDGKIARGGSKAWLNEAPLKPLASFRRRPRKHSRPTTIDPTTGTSTS